MNVGQLGAQWALLKTNLQLAFPHANIPDIFPQSNLWKSFLLELAVTHDLTEAEAGEAVEDVFWTTTWSQTDSAAA